MSPVVFHVERGSATIRVALPRTRSPLKCPIGRNTETAPMIACRGKILPVRDSVGRPDGFTVGSCPAIRIHGRSAPAGSGRAINNGGVRAGANHAKVVHFLLGVFNSTGLDVTLAYFDNRPTPYGLPILEWVPRLPMCKPSPHLQTSDTFYQEQRSARGKTPLIIESVPDGGGWGDN